MIWTLKVLSHQSLKFHFCSFLRKIHMYLNMIFASKRLTSYQIKIWKLHNYGKSSKYSRVSNKRVGCNKRAGWKIYPNLGSFWNLTVFKMDLSCFWWWSRSVMTTIVNFPLNCNETKLKFKRYSLKKVSIWKIFSKKELNVLYVYLIP